MIKKGLNQRGQTLLIVIFAMSLGLLVMVNTASRVVASVARTAQTNNYQKSTAIAEGGAEVFLAKPLEEYNDLVIKCPTSDLADLTSVNTSCISSSVEARAYLGVEEYPATAENILEIRSQPGETIQVNLKGLDSDVSKIQVCWKGLGRAGYSASYYFYYYGTPGDYSVDKNLYTCESNLTNCALPGSDDMKYIEPATKNADHSCYAFFTHNESVALRIFTFPDGADYLIGAYDASDTPHQFPPQGYRIISIGEVTAGGMSLDSRKATRKKVTVEKTFPYPAGPWWDFAVTSIEGSVKTEL